MTSELMVPLVHLNGTSQTELERQLEELSKSLNTALEKLCDAAPHGRDYYTQGPDALKRAQDQWNWRYAQLKKINEETQRLWIAVCDQRKDKK